jgi:uncharacterized protein (TIGR03086 family)
MLWTGAPARRARRGGDVSDLVEMFQRATDRFGQRLQAVGPDQWGVPTPCAGWDVRELVNHVTAEQLWAPHLLAGETIEGVGDRYDGDVLGDDPVGVWDEAVAGAVAAFSEPGALERTVHLSYGDEASREYALQMLTDAAVHGWDLGRATGGDEGIDEDIAALLLGAWTERQAMVRASGVFGEPVEVPDDAPAAHRLLGFLGRRP